MASRRILRMCVTGIAGWLWMAVSAGQPAIVQVAHFLTERHLYAEYYWILFQLTGAVIAFLHLGVVDRYRVKHTAHARAVYQGCVIHCRYCIHHTMVPISQQIQAHEQSQHVPVKLSQNWQTSVFFWAPWLY